jgi:hypothetical protein
MSDNSRVVFDEWETYVAHNDEGPLFISFDVAAGREDLSDALPHCARVLIPVQAPNDAGGPVEPESQRLWDMEDQLCELLAEHGVHCRLVGRVTHAGMRELVFQLAEWESFRAPVGLWMGGIPDYEIDVSEHEGWDFFEECIWPSPEDWQFIADRSVVDNLLKSGSNPEKDHSLEFVFLGKHQDLRRLEAALRQRGYRPLGSLKPGADQLVMVKTMKLDLQDVVAESLANLKLAEEFGVTYDGWGCAVVS